MNFDRSFFSSFKSLSKPIMVNHPNYHRAKVTHLGSVCLLPNLVLQDVLYISSFKFSILSIHKLCK